MVRASIWTVNFLALEDDILLILFEFIPLSSMASLCRTCRRLHVLVNEGGWFTYLKNNQRTCQSLALARNTWSAYDTLKYYNLTDRAWRECSFVARPLSSPWPKRCVPAFAMSDHRIVYAVGRNLQFYAFSPPQPSGLAPGLRFEANMTVQDPRVGIEGARVGRNNITGLAFTPDESSLIAGFEDGSVTEIRLPPSLRVAPNAVRNFIETAIVEPLPNALLYRAKSHIACLHARSQLSLTLSARGEASLYNMSSGATSNLVLGFQRNLAWSAYISNSSKKYAALGTSESESVPLRIHSISESDLCQIPSLALGRKHSDEDDALAAIHRRGSAVLALSDAPPHFGSSGQVLASGWMDGVVRIYDLRNSHRSSNSEVTYSDDKSASVPTLLPVMTMYDRTFRGIGTMSSGGGEGCYIAATSLTDSLIAFWDVRSPRKVQSVHAPVTTDPSPVYALKMESSRLFGATQRRPFVYDFGPGLTPNTYPELEANEADGLKLRSDGIGYRYTSFRSYNETDIQ